MSRSTVPEGKPTARTLPICFRCGEEAKRRTKCRQCGRMLDAWCYALHRKIAEEDGNCSWEMEDLARQRVEEAR
jgi:hypothetical protein